MNNVSILHFGISISEKKSTIVKKKKTQKQQIVTEDKSNI